MKRPVAFLAAFGVLVGSAGCQQELVLDGSIAEAFDLGFSTIELRRNAKAIQISYLKSSGHEVVMRVTYVTVGVEVVAGKALDLGGEYEEGHPRTSVVRAVDGEPLRQLPPVAKGTISFESAPDIGKLVSGNFGCTFGEGGDVGSGRTLSGTFKGKVIEAP